MKTNNNRREFLKKGILVSAAAITMPSLVKGIGNQEPEVYEEEMEPLPVAGKFDVPLLPYAYEALEPHIDKMTMQIHHDKHHQAYVDNLNKACAENKIDASLEDIIKNVSKYPM